MTTMFIETFGRLLPSAGTATSSLEEDLYSIFFSRSLQMGWSALAPDPAPLWDMHEADLMNDQDASLIGFAQVGLDKQATIASAAHRTPSDEGSPADAVPNGANWVPHPPDDYGHTTTDPAVAIPPLVHCFYDALRWFGEVELTAVQVTGMHLSHARARNEFHLAAAFNWFNIQPAQRNQQAFLACSADNLTDDSVLAVGLDLRQWNCNSFEFGSPAPAVAPHAPRPSIPFVDWSTGASSLAVPVAMSRWNTSSIGWIIARVFDVILSLDAPPRHLAVLLSRPEY